MLASSIKSTILEAVRAKFAVDIAPHSVQVQNTRPDVEGDLTVVLFPIASAVKLKPQELADWLVIVLKENFHQLAKTELKGGFLNLFLTADYWLKALKETVGKENYPFQKPDSQPRMMVEYSSPNTNKPLHLGHLRNIFLGDAVANLLEAVGHSVIRTQIINDRGIHICKSMLAWEKFSPVNENGERETPLNSGLKGDKLVGKYYVEFDKRFVAEAKSILKLWEGGDFSNTADSVREEFLRLKAAMVGKDDKAVKGLEGKLLDLAKNETDLLREAKEMLIKWEGKDPQTYLLWSTMNGWVYEGFDRTYERMQVRFDTLYYESETFLLGKDIVEEGLNKGIFYRKEDGSVWVDLTDDGLDEKLLLRSDGTAVYMTQDLGTAVDRYNDFPDLNGIIYTVGNEQDYHFKVLFLILKKMGYAWADNCHHLSYGMVDLPSGKMKSREGTVVDADDLMEEVVQTARHATLERGHIDGMTEKEVNGLCEMIGLGGLKYYLLKVDPKKRMLFNPEESIELNGHTGPFIQYAYARIQSLLSKSTERNFSSNVEIKAEEKELIKCLLLAESVLQEAAESLSPAVLANYLFDLVKAYNHFYQNVSVLNESEAELRAMRLYLSEQVSKLIQKGMKLLGISVPNRM